MSPDVFPAPAGINRFWLLSAALLISVPRASGDKPLLKRIKNNQGGGVPRASGDKPGELASLPAPAMCSPRQRG
ncbi:hypothetical protein IS238_002075 [Salmonella enterica]|nr:hypothetical protein [Salmonella enterica]